MRKVAVPGRFLWSRVFARSLRAPLRVLLRQRSVREGALRRARKPAHRSLVYPILVYLSLAYLPRLRRALRFRVLSLLRLQALGFVRLLRVRPPHRFLPRQFLLCARLLACPPRLT